MRSRLIGSGLALALPFGLAACGDDDSDEVKIVETDEVGSPHDSGNPDKDLEN